MRGSGAIPVLFLGLAAAAFGLIWATVRLTAPDSSGPAAFAAGAVAALVVLGLWAGLRVAVFAPVRRLVRGLRAVRESRSSDAGLGTGTSPLLGELQVECDGLVTALRSSRREARKTAQTESARVDAQKSWLEAIVQGVSRGFPTREPANHWPGLRSPYCRSRT
jgi:DNA polymerase-3 subunit epsilon